MKNRRVIAGSLLAAIAAFIASNEGLRTIAYPDPGKPTIATICYGETQGVYFGDTRSKSECMEMLKRRIPDYLGPVDRMMPDLPDPARVAYADFAYNAGVGRLQRSRIPDLERAGLYKQACNELLRYTTANGRVMRGLELRRERERLICLMR